MILTCPACQTQYIVPEAALGGTAGRAASGKLKARSVKCAACGFGWRQNPISVTEIDLSDPSPAPGRPESDPVATPAAMPSPAATEGEDERLQQTRWQQALQAEIAATLQPPVSLPRFAARTAGWLALLLLVTGISLIYLRDDLAKWWPPSTLFYETVGHPAPLAADALRFKNDVQAALRRDSVPSRLQVSGHFYNVDAHAIALPVLQARVFDAKGVWLKDWSIPLQNIQNIGGKATMGFDYSLPQVPLDAHSLTFRFVDD